MKRNHTTARQSRSKRIQTPVHQGSDGDLKLRACNVERLDKTFKRILAPLKEASRRSEFKTWIALPSHPMKEAHRMALPINDSSVLLLSILEDKILAAIERDDAKLAAFLSIKAGQVSVGLALHELVERGRGTLRAGERTAKTKEKQRETEMTFGLYVWSERQAYERQCASNHKPPTRGGFREHIRAWIAEWIRRGSRTTRAVARRMMGTAGTDGDGVMSARSLKRAIQNLERYN